MKRIPVFIILWAVVSIAFIGNSFAQIRYAGTKERFFNSGSVSLKNNRVLQWDTTWTMLFNAALDTTKRVWVIDTSGVPQYAYGSDAKYWKGADHGDSTKGVFTDTLYMKKGQGHLIKVIAHTSVSADTIMIHGRVLQDPFISISNDSARIDSITPATGAGTLSKYAWTEIDSIHIRTSPAGTDCVRILYRPVLAAKQADSNSVTVAGVLTGYSYLSPRDTVAADSFGYMIVDGNAQVYMSGGSSSGSRAIVPGNRLVVGNGGKVIKVHDPKEDTVKTSVAREARYLQGAAYGDIISVTKMRDLRTPATGDTVVWGAHVTLWGTKKDTIIFNATGTKGETPTTSLTDSLFYRWFPRGYIDKWPHVIIGRALEECRTDSTLKWIDLDIK